MLESEPLRVQELPLEPEVAGDAVRRIARNRKVDRGEMDADLVRAARLEPDAQERVARQQLLELEVGHGRAGRIRVERVTEPVMTVAADGRVDRPSARAWLADDESTVLARQRAALHELLQPFVCLRRPGDDEQSRGVAVEAVNDSRPVLLPAGCTGLDESLGERAACVTGRRMHDDAGGLVDDEEMLVLVRDHELGEIARRLRDGRRRRLDRDLLTADELVALGAGLTVHQHGARGEEPLGCGARSDVGQAGEMAVEPLSRGLRRDDEPFQRLGLSPRPARGSFSVRTSAARRIPTPITMQLSATLKAGQ